MEEDTETLTTAEMAERAGVTVNFGILRLMATLDTGGEVKNGTYSELNSVRFQA